MNLAQREAVLGQWVRPSSDSEQQKQDRAVRMVKAAMVAWPAFDGVSHGVYSKGSYANNTNVRLDSDVDVVVQNHECLYYEYVGCEALPDAHATPYTGVWTPQRWRREIVAALTSAFPDEVSGSGKVAISIDEHDGTRPDIDVVPAFDFVRYDSADRSANYAGSKVFPTSGPPIINYPDQQLANGRAKNSRTNSRYKKFARALKSAENRLVTEGIIDAKPSYFMECLAWNVPDHVLTSGTGLSEGFAGTLRWLWKGLSTETYERTAWEEPNQLKYLFHGAAKWKPADARELILATWQYLDYS